MRPERSPPVRTEWASHRWAVGHRGPFFRVGQNYGMTGPQSSSSSFSERTAWARNLQTPLREFLRTETGSAALLLVATVLALLWANTDSSSYEAFWGTRLSIRVGDMGVSQDLRHWMNNGLMTFYFFVIGLEARREFDMGELRERRRMALPLLVGIGGMIVPVMIYLAVNAGLPSSHGWGAAMSTDTAFALGILALVGTRFPERLRAFMLNISVVDDIVALGVIVIVYSGHISMPAFVAACGIFGVTLLVRANGVRAGLVYGLLGAATWVALFKSGVDPLVVGLAMGLLTFAYPAARSDLERASGLFRLFREQPTPEFARSAQQGLVSAISPNERLQQLYHPWTSYVIVPLFALSNIGIAIDGALLSRAFTSPITLGILFGYLLGKPVGIVAVSWLVTRLSRGRLRPPVGWAAVLGGGTIAGIGFTVSLLVASIAFSGTELEEAKIGVLSAAICASVLTWVVARATAFLPLRVRIRALFGTAESLVDLAAPVDSRRDHVRGPAEALVTVVEYGDFECPYCGLAEPVVRELLADFGDVRYVWRHLPLNDVHPNAQLAAEAVEAAAAQGAFWEMHDRLLEDQGELSVRDLIRHAEVLGLDVEQFHRDLREHLGAPRVAEDVDSADLSGVSGTPTFFLNGRRHQGAYDIATLSAAVRAARARAAIRS
ncbi:sodium/proton antiporter, NhaA family [Streptosporangium subroseum]|uniref:Na(+)/H(+) antiporter NhaA n=2 Tax=Streptosporangium subroseum TaxID=106412 RepID=A0A239AA18_9ACTN|nr:sodium/proton antiporter, NhaA family [Streptosporangium subroseum]